MSTGQIYRPPSADSDANGTATFCLPLAQRLPLRSFPGCTAEIGNDYRPRIEVSESMDTVTETRTMSGVRESTAKAADKGKCGAIVRADDQRAGKLGRKHSHESYALTMQSAGAAIFDCPSLSIRECGILELIGQGYSNKKAARTLGISAETVKSHVKRVFIKLDVNTRAHAVSRAQSLGLFGLKFVRPRSVIAAREFGDSVSA